MLSVCAGDSSGKHGADKRLLFCKQSSDLRRLSFSPFHTASFVSAWSSRPLRYWFPGGSFDSINECCTLHWVVTLDVLAFEQGTAAIPSNWRLEKAGVSPVLWNCVELSDFNIKVCLFLPKPVVEIIQRPAGALEWIFSKHNTDSKTGYLK